MKIFYQIKAIKVKKIVVIDVVVRVIIQMSVMLKQILMGMI